MTQIVSTFFAGGGLEVLDLTSQSSSLPILRAMPKRETGEIFYQPLG